MDGPLPRPGHRPRPRKAFATSTTVAFAGVAAFVACIFLAGHNSVVHMHSAMQSPVLEPAAGWMHRTTTVESATVTISGDAITGSALTATTTETTAAAGAAAAAAGAGASAGAASAGAQQLATAATAATATTAATAAAGGPAGSLAHMLGDLQHSLHSMLSAHAGWKPGDKITRAQLAAAAAASVPDEGRDIELHPQRVAQVVQGAQLHQQLQALAKGGSAIDAGALAAAAAGQPSAGGSALTSAEALAGLYGEGAGTVVFAPHDDLDSCPEGSSAAKAAQAAVVLLAGGSRTRLKRSLDELVSLYGGASPDVRAAFHLFVGLDGDDEAMRQLAHGYALDTLGAVKLVHHSSSGGMHASSNRRYDKQQQQQQVGKAEQGGVAGEAAPTRVTRRLLADGAEQPQQQQQQQPKQAGEQQAQEQLQHAEQQQPQQPQQQQQQQEQQEQLPQQQQQQHQEQQQHQQREQQSQQPAASGSADAAAGNGGPATPAPAPAPTAGAAGAGAPHPEHLRLMLHVFFRCLGYPAVLLLEDDARLSPDALEFYAAAQWLLGSDPTLYCVSAWNPVGQKQQHVHPWRVMRTDYNPARGWLLTRQTGLELLSSWPNTTALDWAQHVRSHAVRAGRQCLVPEMPRMAPAGADDAAGADGADGGEQPRQDGAQTAGDGKTLVQGDPIEGPAAGGELVVGGGGGDQGAFDAEAYAADYDASAQLPGEAGGDQQAQQEGADGADGEGRAGEEPQGPDGGAGDGGAGDGGKRPRSGAGWMQRDLSSLLSYNYADQMHRALLAAAPCDVATASVLRDTSRACRVPYNSSPYLLATGHRLGMPVEAAARTRYCYDLPATQEGAVYELCQEYMPEMAYEGVVAGYNRHGARVYLVHAKYDEALGKQLAMAGAPPATLGAEAAAAGAAPAPAAAPRL